MQILRLAGGFYKEAITSAVQELCRELDAEVSQQILSNCKGIEQKHFPAFGWQGDKFDKSFVEGKDYPVVVAYLSIGDDDRVKKGGSASRKVFEQNACAIPLL